VELTIGLVNQRSHALLWVCIFVTGSAAGISGAAPIAKAGCLPAIIEAVYASML
jgi:hypothetical protein